MLFFGIDWSCDHHDVCIRSEAGECLSRLRIEHSAEGFRRLEAERSKFAVPAHECLVGIETAYNLLVDYLVDLDYVVYIIAPKATDGYRNRQRLSGAHDDASDAALLADIVRTDRASHRQWRANAALTQQILGQVRLIEVLRQSIQRQTNQLREALVRTYPAALDTFKDLNAQIALHFLAAYPTAPEAAELSGEQFAAFCREHGYYRKDVTLRYAQLHKTVPTARPAVVQAQRNQVRVLAQVLLGEVRYRLEALTELRSLFAQHPDAPIFDSLPGAGDLLAPALLAKFGDDRTRFLVAADVQALAGTCPVTARSGRVTNIRFRKGCDHEFRRIVQAFALLSVKQSGWAQAAWQEIRRHTRSDSHATRILANRWLAIIWKLWQTRCPYDEAYYLQQRSRRCQPKKG